MLCNTPMQTLCKPSTAYQYNPLVPIQYPSCSKFVRSFKEDKTCHGANSRLCWDIGCLNTHFKSVYQGKKHPNACKVFVNPAYSKCGVFGVQLDFLTDRGQAAGKDYFLISLIIFYMSWNMIMHPLQAQLKSTGHFQSKQRIVKTQILCKILGISLGYRLICCLLV